MGEDETRPEVGVWWDINSCPVLDNIDPRYVFGTIESAMKKQFGIHRRVVIFAVGNLEYIPSDILKNISCSGITLIHAPHCGESIKYCLRNWSQKYPPPAEILLITNCSLWYNQYILNLGYTILSAYQANQRPLPSSTLEETSSTNEFVWETLLEANLNEKYLTLPMSIEKHQKVRWYCETCERSSKSFDKFIDHLKGYDHFEQLIRSVPYLDNGIPVHYCQVCDYLAYDEYNLGIHYNSPLHLAEKKAQERKRTPEEDLLN